MFLKTYLQPGDHVMVDLETMSRHPNAAIVAIGAQRFTNEGKVKDTFYVNVSLESCVVHGLHLEPATIMWWMQQSDAARKALFENAASLRKALDGFANWLGEDDYCLWGNGSDFDNVILESAYDAVGIERPWAYYQNRCYKTLKALLGEDVEKPADVGTAHNALDDAKYQTQYMLKMLGLA